MTCARYTSDALYVVQDDTRHLIKLGIATGDGRDRFWVHRRDGFNTVIRYLPELADAAVLEQHVLKTLAAAGFTPVRGREYFDQTALAVVLDIVDNWIMTANS